MNRNIHVTRHIPKDKRCKYCQISEMTAAYLIHINRAKVCVNEDGHVWIED